MNQCRIEKEIKTTFIVQKPKCLLWESGSLMKWVIRRTFLVLALCICNLKSFPQLVSWPVDVLDIGNGLSQGSVLSIFQDHEGFMWFGTYDGLNLYNGKTFKVYRPIHSDSTSLTSNYIKAITEDREGNLYVGTAAGLNILDRNTDTFTALAGRLGSNILGKSDEIYALVRDHNDKIWIAANSGLFIYIPSEKKFQDLPDALLKSNLGSKSIIRCFYLASDNSIWIGTQNQGVFRVTGDRADAFQIKAGTGGISNNSILTLNEDSLGSIWIGTPDGLNQYNPVQNTITRYLTSLNQAISARSVQVSCLIETSRNDLLAGTRDYRGLYLLNRKKGQLGPVLLYDNRTGKQIVQSFNSVFEDRSGILWLGTSEGGIIKAKLYKKPFHGITPDVMGSSSTFSLLEDSHGKIWIGTRQGIAIWNRDKNTYQIITPFKNRGNSLSGNRIWGMAEDKKGNIWIGTSYGLNRYDPEKGLFMHYLADSTSSNSILDNEIISLYIDAKGQLWIGTAKGLSTLNTDTGEFNNYRYDPGDPTSLSGNTVLEVFSDSKGRTWVATQNGLSLYLPGKNAFKVYRNDPADENSLSHNYTLSLCEDNEGYIWIGTHGYGIDRLDPETGQFTNYSMDNGLPNNTVYDIQEENGSLWFGTNFGLTKLNIKTGNITVYSENDGILSNEFNPPTIRTRDGLLLFGSVKGVIAFHTDSIKAVSYTPPLVFTDLKVNNSSIRPGQFVLSRVLLDRVINRITALNFNYRIREFSIEFASLEYTSPEKIKYRYKIEEFGDDWIDLGNKDFISFTGLMPGTYHLHVTSTNSDGIWSDNSKSLKIVILPPWWRTRLFILLATIAVTALTVGFIRYRTWRLKRDKVSLENLVSMRTLEVEKQNKEIKAQHEEIKNQKDYIEEQNVLLEKHRDRLEDLVEERTRELKNEKEKAEESNRLKTAFLQNLSHEIRTPLNAIMGFSELLHRKEYDEQEKVGFTEIIINSSRHLLSIMNNILTISSLETGQEKTDKKVVIISDIIDELVPLFYPVAVNKGISFTVKHPENENQIKTLLLITDEHMLQQVLHHIINNALKFTQQGSIEVGYTTNDDFVKFYVKDTGIGIHPEFISKIFDRFRKGEIYKSIEDGGTGLGLSIAKAYVELLGGKIWVESESGKGSTFFFTIQFI